MKSKGLSRRELEVLKLITDGMVNKQIALELFISEKTVKNHIASIFRKTDSQNRSQAVVYALTKLTEEEKVLFNVRSE